MPESNYSRGQAPREGILASQPVSASEWLAGARLQNHIAGRGRVLVPAMRPDHGALNNTTYAYAFRIVPSYQALKRAWRVSVRGDGTVTIDVNGDTLTHPDPSYFADLSDHETPRGITFEEVLGSQSSAESDATVTFDHTSAGGALIVDSIDCFEHPRAVIGEGGLEGGVNLAGFRASQPITSSTFEDVYTGAMKESAGARVLFQWAVPYEVGGATDSTFTANTSSSTFGDVFGLSKSCLARTKFNDGDYTTCNARVFAWVSGGGTPSGEVRVSSDDGTSTAVTITNTSPAWSTQITDANILHEDLSTSDGIPTSGYDEVQFEFRATVGTLHVASAILYE